MKKIIYTLLLMIASFNAVAQFIVDAGNDHYFCETDTSFQLGGNPTITGGTTPYQIKWETTFQYSSTFADFTASYFLDDSTATNPIYTHDNIVDVLHFYLTVTDAIGMTAYDTVSIYPSSFSYTLGQCVEMITQGDTVSIGTSAYGGIGTLNYAWSPNYNISDTTSESPEVWPDTSMTYFCIITDSIGCLAGSDCRFWVFPVNTNDVKRLITKVYPNPTNGLLTLESTEITQVWLTDITGKVVWQDDKFQGQTLDISFLENGLYFLKLQNSKGETGVFKILRE